MLQSLLLFNCTVFINEIYVSDIVFNFNYLKRLMRIAPPTVKYVKQISCTERKNPPNVIEPLCTFIQLEIWKTFLNQVLE